MSRKRDRKQFPPSTENSSPPLLNRQGWLKLGGGIFLLVMGFVTLSFTDSKGGNIASDLSPLFLLAGYGLIAFAIWSGTPRPGKP